MTDAATATAKPVKSDEEIKKDLTILEANPGPYDEKFIETHRKKIHDLLDRVKKSGDDGLGHRIHSCFEKHYDELKDHIDGLKEHFEEKKKAGRLPCQKVKEGLHNEKEKIEEHMHKSA